MRLFEVLMTTRLQFHGRALRAVVFIKGLRRRDSRGLFAARVVRSHGRGPDGLRAEQLHAALRRAGGRGA